MAGILQKLIQERRAEIATAPAGIQQITRPIVETGQDGPVQVGQLRKEWKDGSWSEWQEVEPTR